MVIWNCCSVLFVDEANRQGDEAAAAAADAAQQQKQNDDRTQAAQQAQSTAVATSPPVCIMPGHYNCLAAPVPSGRQHLGNDDCLEDKREDCQNSSVLCCLARLHTMVCTHVRIYEHAYGCHGVCNQAPKCAVQHTVDCSQAGRVTGVKSCGGI